MDRYHIFLACPFETCETDGHRFPFYEKLAHTLESFEKRLFLPHKELLGLKYPAQVADIAISRAELVLCDTGIPSCAAGIMLQTAFDRHKPVISFRNLDDPYDGINDRILERALNAHRSKRLSYCRDEDGLSTIVGAIRELYGPTIPGWTN